MNPRQHPISTHLERFFSVLLPGGYWHIGQFFAKPCPAGHVAFTAMKPQAMRNRVDYRGNRIA